MRKYQCKSCKQFMWLEEQPHSCCFCDSSRLKEREDDGDERINRQEYCCGECETEWEIESDLEPDLCPCCSDDSDIIEII